MASWASRRGENLLLHKRCAKRGAESNELAPSYFFSRTASSRYGIKRFFTTIACRICSSIPEAGRHIRRIVDDDPLVIHSTTSSQPRGLLVQPILSINLALLTIPPLIVVDGLDECQGGDNQQVLLAHMRECIERYQLPL